MLIIAVVGLARSGKDTVARKISESHGFKHFDFYANVIRPLMKKQGIKPSKENAARFGNKMRARFGMGVFGEKMAELVKGKDRVVVTGVRSLEELKPLEELASELVIVRVNAPKKQRFARKSNLDPSDREEFFKRDKNDLFKKGLSRALKAADYSINNNGSLKELEKKVKEFMEKIE